jgi:hypothetical protein
LNAVRAFYANGGKNKNRLTAARRGQTAFRKETIAASACYSAGMSGAFGAITGFGAAAGFGAAGLRTRAAGFLLFAAALPFAVGFRPRAAEAPFAPGFLLFAPAFAAAGSGFFARGMVLNSAWNFALLAASARSVFCCKLSQNSGVFPKNLASRRATSAEILVFPMTI